MTGKDPSDASEFSFARRAFRDDTHTMAGCNVGPKGPTVNLQLEMKFEPWARYRKAPATVRGRYTCQGSTLRRLRACFMLAERPQVLRGEPELQKRERGPR